VFHPCFVDAILRVDIVHVNIGDGFNPLGCSTCLPLCEVLDERLGSVVARDLRITSSPPIVPTIASTSASLTGGAYPSSAYMRDPYATGGCGRCLHWPCPHPAPPLRRPHRAPAFLDLSPPSVFHVSARELALCRCREREYAAKCTVRACAVFLPSYRRANGETTVAM
jgi:hypothetical protein